MQVPWTVSIHPATNYVAIGQCLPVYIDLLDASGKDIPRNPTGQRVSIADFDWSASGNAAVGKYNGPNAWAVCACPAAAVGSTIHVMAKYPAASLAEKAKVPGLAFRIVHRVAGHACARNEQSRGVRQRAGDDDGGHIGAGWSSATCGAAAARWRDEPSGRHDGAQAGATPPTGQPYLPPVQLAPPAAAPVAPSNPKRFSAMQVGDGMVALSWMPVPGAAYYQLSGPGLPNTTATVTSSTTQSATGVPRGTQTWTVAGVFMPGNVTTPPTQFATAQLLVTSGTYAGGTPPPSGSAYPPGGAPPVRTTSAPPSGTPTTTASPPSGTAYPPGGNSSGTPPANAPPPTNAPASNRYRVVATGFRVLHQTKDDVFSRDGHGDEVYGGFMAFHYDRNTSKLVDQNLRRTNVIGEHGYDGLGFGRSPAARTGRAVDLMTTGADPAVKNARHQGWNGDAGRWFRAEQCIPGRCRSIEDVWCGADGQHLPVPRVGRAAHRRSGCRRHSSINVGVRRISRRLQQVASSEQANVIADLERSGCAGGCCGDAARDVFHRRERSRHRSDLHYNAVERVPALCSPVHRVHSRHSRPARTIDRSA